MERNNDIEAVCPRPRNTRACNKCRARKIRCLPGKRPSEANTCQRCAKFGYTCSYERPTDRKTQSAKEQTTNGDQLRSDDIISSLFENEPKQTDETSQIFGLHRRIFQDQLNESCSSEAPAEDLKTLGQSATPVIHHTAPDGNITVDEAEKLIAQFRHRRAYFPFIGVPENVSVTWLAKHRPFLLLAILTVTSSRMPRLQQKADGRFRRVLSERVIFHGEQSLDYAQGLLVYIAWYPMHKRPLRNQLFQFMQIAMTMVSDLRLAQQVHNKEALNTSIACYNLSCLRISIHRRSENGPTADRFDLAAHIMPGSDEDVGIQHTRLQMLHEEVSSYKPDMNHQDIASRCSLETHEAVKVFYQKIDALNSVLPPDIQDNIAFRLSRLYLKVAIAFLPLKPLQSDRAQRHDTQLPALEIQSLATTCFSEVQEFLEALLSIPLDQYIYFSTREWSHLILTISTASKLCFSHLASADVTETRAFQIKIRAKMLIYLESLAHRMGNLSVTPIPSTQYPDFFCLFKSVLEIITPTYAPPPSGYQPADIGTGTCPVTHQNQTEPYHREMDAQGAVRSASRCPILNGTIKDTDFWRAFEQSTPISDESAGDGPANLQGNDVGQISMEDVLDVPSDWSTFFSDWVVDLNNMPE